MTRGATGGGGICVVGSINTDLVIRVASLPEPGETVLGGRFETTPGGKGANQAVAAARLGAHVDLIGRVGRDAHGQVMRSVLEAEGVGVAGVSVDPDEPTGIALITVADAGGENTIVVAPGANARLEREHVDQVRSLLREAKVVLLQLEIAIDTVAHAARLARGYGKTVILNAAPARPLPADFLADVDVLVVNRTEAAIVAGDRVTGANSLPRDRLAAALVGRGGSGPAAVIVTLGADGAIAHDGRHPFAVPAPRVEAVDTVGAGDAFCGGLAVRLAEGADLREAVPFACAAGSLATTRRGAIASLPTRRQVGG